MWSLKRIPPIRKHTLCVQFPGSYKVFLNYLDHVNLVALKVMEWKLPNSLTKLAVLQEKKEPNGNAPVENVLYRQL